MDTIAFAVMLALGLTVLAVSIMYGGSKLYIRTGLISYLGLPIILAGMVPQTMAGLIVLGILENHSLVPSANAKERAIDPFTLDIAGVKIGMSPAEARAGLEEAGYSVSDDRMGASWKAWVASEAGKYANTPRDNSQSVHYTIAEGPDFQKIEVQYEVRPGGSRVRKIEYSRPARVGDIRPQARAKYGEPTRTSVNGIRYCQLPKDCPQGFMMDSQGPSLEVYNSYTARSMIILSQGTLADADWKIAFMAAVQNIAPTYGKAAF